MVLLEGIRSSRVRRRCGSEGLDANDLYGQTRLLHFTPRREIRSLTEQHVVAQANHQRFLACAVKGRSPDTLNAETERLVSDSPPGISAAPHDDNASIQIGLALSDC
jgi:hypothetical protein